MASDDIKTTEKIRDIIVNANKLIVPKAVFTMVHEDNLYCYFEKTTKRRRPIEKNYKSS